MTCSTCHRLTCVVGYRGSPEALAVACAMFRDGASQREVCRTTGLSRGKLRRHFPGEGWTYREGGQFRALTSNTDMEGIGGTA